MKLMRIVGVSAGYISLLTLAGLAQSSVTTSGGTTNAIPVFSGSTSIANSSALKQNGSGNLEISGTVGLGIAPASDLLRIHATAGYPSWANPFRVSGGYFQFAYNHQAPYASDPGAVGIFLDKNPLNTTHSNAITWTIGGVPKWSIGMDAENSEMVPLYLGGRGDILRFKSSRLECNQPHSIVAGVLGAQSIGTVPMDCERVGSTPLMTFYAQWGGISATFSDGGANFSEEESDASTEWQGGHSNLSFAHVETGETRVVADGEGQWLSFWTNGTALPKANPVGGGELARATMKVKIGLTSGSALEVRGGVQLNTSDSRPSCDADHRGQLWFTRSAAPDTLSVCILNGSTYQWKTVTLF